MKHIYLDYAAATPVAPEVEAEMKKYFRKHFGNAGSIHLDGQYALAAIDSAREHVASALGAKFHEIIFTSSATEANNIALRGTVRAYKKLGKKTKPRIIISAIEHSSVYGTARDLEADGDIELAVAPVDRYGRVGPNAVKDLLTPETVLVSIIYASNEIGTIEPVSEIGRIVSAYREQHGGEYPLFHTDAVQAFQFLDMNVQALSVDILSLSGQKIYGPKGAAALYIREGAQKRMRPIMTGGAQEFGFRPATENTPAIIGLGSAVRLIETGKKKEALRIKALRDRLWCAIKKAGPSIELLGAPIEEDATCLRRLPNNISVFFPGVKASDMVVRLDMEGISASPGSACSARASKPSRVISSLGLGDERPSESVRFSIGRCTTREEVDEAAKRIQSIVKTSL